MAAVDRTGRYVSNNAFVALPQVDVGGMFHDLHGDFLFFVAHTGRVLQCRPSGSVCCANTNRRARLTPAVVLAAADLRRRAARVPVAVASFPAWARS